MLKSKQLCIIRSIEEIVHFSIKIYSAFMILQLNEAVRDITIVL